MATIIELRKQKFIQEFHQEDFNKLLRSINKNPKHFDNDFYISAFSEAMKRKSCDALIMISRLHLEKERLIEAEFVLTKAYELNEKNQNVLFWLIEIYCRRYAFFHAYGILDQISDKEIKIKSLSKIKVQMITGLKEEVWQTIKESFSTLKTDSDYITLIFQVGFINDDYRIFILILTSNIAIAFYNNITIGQRNRIKKILIRKLIGIIKK